MGNRDDLLPIDDAVDGFEGSKYDTCIGCRRVALYPKWTLRFWSRDDPDDPVPGRWMHVDPSGSTYDCTAPDARVPEDDDAE